MAQTLHITVDGGVGGGAVINAKIDGVQFFNAIGSAPDNLTYDNYIGSIQTNSGNLDLLVQPPANNTGTLVIKLSGALNQNINIPSAGRTTGSGYNNFIRSIPIGEKVPPVSPELSEYFEIIQGAYFSGNSIVITDDSAYNIRLIRYPEGGQFTFTVSASEFAYGGNYYFATYGFSNLNRYMSGVPYIDHNANGLYIDPLNIKNDYNGIVTLKQTTSLAMDLPCNLRLGAGTWIVNEIEPPAEEDPYNTGGNAGTGGGTGTFDLTSDAIDFPTLPTLSAVSTGLVSIYTPTLAQVNALASYMWNANPTDIDWWKKLVANPLDLILGFSIVPVQVPQGATNSVKVGLIDTGVSMTRAASQFVEVDCGSIEVKGFYGAALDYLPYRKTSIYLPFIGTRTISTDDIMNKIISVKYHVDLLSGACTAMVKCGDAVLYQYSGACAVSLPLTGETFTNMITSTIQLAASAGGAVALGGAAAAGPVAGAAIAGAAISGGASLANSVIASKPTIERAGGVSGAAGQLGIMTPYLIGEIPRQSVAENYNTFVGYPSNIKATLADLSGFTTVESIHLQGIPATSTEYAEIERLLKEGVIL